MLYLFYRPAPLAAGLKFLKKLVKKFASLIFCRTFAIPNQSGGGEMVDTLL